MEVSSGDDSSRLLGGRSYAAKWLPALTLSADVDLEQGAKSGGVMGGREREMDRTHAGTTKGREQAPRLSDRSAGGRCNQCADEVIISCPIPYRELWEVALARWEGHRSLSGYQQTGGPGREWLGLVAAALVNNSESRNLVGRLSKQPCWSWQ